MTKRIFVEYNGRYGFVINSFDNKYEARFVGFKVIANKNQFKLIDCPVVNSRKD